ncbi:MAG: XdhC family protein [Acidimicrobiales bacterium]
MLPSLGVHESALRRTRQPYATVKVVWSGPPVSGKPGDAALVSADGRLDGWVGGSCSEPVVIREALAAMRSGRPRLLHLGPAGSAWPEREGVVTVVTSCASEGAIEVFVEPHLPPARLVVVGRAPVVRVLVDTAVAIGMDVLVVEREPAGAGPVGAGPVGAGPAGGESWPDGVQASDDLDLGAAGVGAGCYVVVATFGRYDEDALAAALATDADYVGLVASAKRGASVLGLLGSMGVAEEAIARVQCPAGLDLGSTTHAEIAVAVLAEIVALMSRSRAAQLPEAGAAGTAGRPAVAADPVCGMTVDLATSIHTATHDGITYAFCCGGCRQRFLADPESFLAPGMPPTTNPQEPPASSASTGRHASRPP